MPEPETSAAAWGLLPALLVVLGAGLGLALLVAAVDRAVVSRSGARAWSEPARAGTRLLLEQRRSTTAPDDLLWRAGCITVPVAALLSLAVVPISGRPLRSSSADLVWFNAMEAILWVAGRPCMVQTRCSRSPRKRREWLGVRRRCRPEGGPRRTVA